MSEVLPFRVMCYAGFPFGAFLRRSRPERRAAPLAAPNSYLMLRGSTAIWEAFRLLDLPRGSEVLFPTYHCGLELDVLAKAGLRPVFYGVTDSLGIDIDDLESRITASTQAVYVIHYFGFPHDLPSLRALCDRRGLRLIEDGAQAFASAMPRGGDAPRAVGTFGDVGIFSLHKSLPVPDGGALVLNDPDLPPPRLARRPGWFETLQHAKLILARDLYKVGAIRGVLRWLLLGVLSPCVRRAKELLRGSPERDGRSQSPGRGGAQAGTPRDAEWVFPDEWKGVGISPLARFLLDRLDHGRVAERRRAAYKRLLEASRNWRKIVPVLPRLPEGVCPCYFPVFAGADARPFIDYCRGRRVRVDPYWPDTHPLVPTDDFPQTLELKRRIAVLPVHHELTAKEVAALISVVDAWERLEDDTDKRCEQAEAMAL